MKRVVITLSQDFVLSLARQTVTLGLTLAAPALLVGLTVGVLISILQAMTQIQEQTLTFVPKIVAVALVFLAAGAWMLNNLTSFTTGLFSSLATLVR